MRTRAENLSILRNASGGSFSAGGPSGERVRSRDESLRILLNREGVKHPVNRTPGWENYSPMPPNDSWAARKKGAPLGGA